MCGGVVETPRGIYDIYVFALFQMGFFGLELVLKRTRALVRLACLDEMNSRELFIAISLLSPTLLIGFWPRIATDIFESSSNAIANNLAVHKIIAFVHIVPLT